MPAPFDCSDSTPPKSKQPKSNIKGTVTDLDVVECCFNFLQSDVTFFKNSWQWSKFIETFCTPRKIATDYAYALYCNHIVGLLTNMTGAQLKRSNANIPLESVIDFEMKHSSGIGASLMLESVQANQAVDSVTCDIRSDCLTNVEGVMLPIFDEKNYNFSESHSDGKSENIVLVSSTKINLRSLAVGVAAGKAICLSGPVGSGKTTLVEFLARKTGRIAPKYLDIERAANANRKPAKENTAVNGNGDKKEASKKSKRKRADDDVENEEIQKQLEAFSKSTPTNGFLRIQLGDQTDSKMLLGQYRCTDVPGEFVWQPGVLTQVSDGVLSS